MQSFVTHKEWFLCLYSFLLNSPPPHPTPTPAFFFFFFCARQIHSRSRVLRDLERPRVLLKITSHRQQKPFVFQRTSPTRALFQSPGGSEAICISPSKNAWDLKWPGLGRADRVRKHRKQSWESWNIWHRQNLYHTPRAHSILRARALGRLKKRRLIASPRDCSNILQASDSQRGKIDPILPQFVLGYRCQHPNSGSDASRNAAPELARGRKSN